MRSKAGSPRLATCWPEHGSFEVVHKIHTLLAWQADRTVPIVRCNGDCGHADETRGCTGRRGRDQGTRLLGAGLDPTATGPLRARRRFAIALLLFAAFAGAPIAAALLGHGPNDLFYTAMNARGAPVGPWSTVADPAHPGQHTLFILGADSTLGRDEFLRVLYGARVSFEVGILATLGSVTIGTIMGCLAGFYRGWVDTLVSRVTEITMAFQRCSSSSRSPRPSAIR